MVVFYNPHIIDDFSSLLREKSTRKKILTKNVILSLWTQFIKLDHLKPIIRQRKQQNGAPPFSQYLSPVGGGKHYHITF